MSDRGFDFKVLDAQDGVGMQLLMQNEIKVAVITTANISTVAGLLEKFGVICFSNIDDKRVSYIKLKEMLNFKKELFTDALFKIFSTTPHFDYFPLIIPNYDYKQLVAYIKNICSLPLERCQFILSGPFDLSLGIRDELVKNNTLSEQILQMHLSKIKYVFSYT